jgi:hypothetical protein
MPTVRSGSGVDSGRALDLPEAGEQVDEDRRDVGRPGASSLMSISSRVDEEAWPESLRATASFGCRWMH